MDDKQYMKIQSEAQADAVMLIQLAAQWTDEGADIATEYVNNVHPLVLKSTAWTLASMFAAAMQLPNGEGGDTLEDTLRDYLDDVLTGQTGSGTLDT